MGRAWILLALVSVGWAQSGEYGFGRSATAEEVRAANITVLPNGVGLPPGKGTALKGGGIYKTRCAICHNSRGEGRKGEYPALAGGKGSLATAHPVKTVGSYWPYATTVWDYINRAMPFNAPRTLRPDDVYSVTAFVLYLNGIVSENQELNERTLPAIVMPNRNGFVPDSRAGITVRR